MTCPLNFVLYTCTCVIIIILYTCTTLFLLIFVRNFRAQKWQSYILRGLIFTFSRKKWTRGVLNFAKILPNFNHHFKNVSYIINSKAFNWWIEGKSVLAMLMTPPETFCRNCNKTTIQRRTELWPNFDNFDLLYFTKLVSIVFV